jgi:hypothetical protein
MSFRFHYSVIVLMLWSGLAAGQLVGGPRMVTSVDAVESATARSAPDFGSSTVLPRMAPELALRVFQERAANQSQKLAGYSAITLIHAELPQTSQKGEFELERHYAAPHTLEFTALRYTGDGFVKNNVITRLLQSEVEHVKQDDRTTTAVNEANYKISYRGSGPLNGRIVHVYQVKPRKKRPGLFKGKIFLDAYTGAMVRAEGSVVKSPSFFVKKIEFVQDYAEVGSFTLPTHVHSDAIARVIGRTVVDIYHRDYQPVAAGVQSAQHASSDSLVSAQ